MMAPSTTPSATPSAKPSMVVASVCKMCGQRIGNFWISVVKICEGRGRIRSDMPVIRQNSSQATKNSAISAADQAFCLRLSRSGMSGSLLRRGAGIDDQGAELLVKRDEVRLERHCDRARPRKLDAAVVEDAAGPCAHHADAAGEEAGLAQIMRHQQHGRPVRHPEALEN